MKFNRLTTDSNRAADCLTKEFQFPPKGKSTFRQR